ncbi:MAG: helix-turn-helix domain-containing protein, partial [Cohnella sp.]|nr:helix-turn-helix domain-containing protein [Cohnella sp.]
VYDIHFVGEAKDGHSALSMLSKNKVDLMFVDISMPGMTGFELMDKVRSLYPHIKSVVLTCHHEFDYVQAALRLGAIDYIVKTLLNRGNVDETMKRILKRLTWESRDAKASQARPFPGAIAYCSFELPPNKEALLSFAPAGRRMTKLTDSIWIQSVNDTDTSDRITELPHSLHARWRPMMLAPSDRLSQGDAETLIARALPSLLFYGAVSIPQSGLPLETLAEEAAQARNGEADGTLQAISDELAQMRWLFYGKDWKRLVELIEAGQPDPVRLIELAGGLAEDWTLYFEWESDADSRTAWKPEQPPQNWRQVRNWLSDMAAALQRRMVELSLSREVVVCLLQAVAYMKRNAASDLNQNTVAKQIGMSRSYFSQCYKKFTGVSFGDALRSMKIEQAKGLLSTTELSVYEIASAIGFEDDKHFSRVFRERTGAYPTEYRTRSEERGSAHDSRTR